MTDLVMDLVRAMDFEWLGFVEELDVGLDCQRQRHPWVSGAQTRR